MRLAPYASPVDRWIIAMKYRGDWSWATWFAKRLAERIGHESDRDRSVVCPVPMHWLRRVRRGYNQAALIATTLASATGLPFAALLKRTRYTHPQTTVTPSLRHENVRDSFAMPRVDLNGWVVWLVDDVKTSGATLTACAHLLRRAGARRICVAVAAA